MKADFAAAGPAQSAVPRRPDIQVYAAPTGLLERVTAAILRGALKLTIKPFFGPPWPAPVIRASLHLGALAMPQDGRAVVHRDQVGSMYCERILPRGRAQPRQAVLYQHGGAFCSGSPRTHRSITRRLAALTGALVFVPHYRLIPEHPFPAQIEDCVAAYRQLLAMGYTPDRIAVAGDSAGGNLSYMLVHALRLNGLPLPSSVVMISPVLSDEVPTSGSAVTRAARDPMIRPSIGPLIVRWSRFPASHPLLHAKGQDLSDFPPALIQVGDDEVLLDDAHWAAEALAAAGRDVRLEVHMARWHVFQCHAGMLRSSDEALAREATFMQRHWAN
jgi:acetyl esterase/lipase